ncbi:MAG: hypothetical protein ACP5H0_07935 [Caldisericum sp.]|uniref:hypothetical protein n=1 Tax=Caldisericum sp. TaxID=2499687 RepID=UPI003D0CC688
MREYEDEEYEAKLKVVKIIDDYVFIYELDAPDTIFEKCYIVTTDDGSNELVRGAFETIEDAEEFADEILEEESEELESEA